MPTPLACALPPLAVAIALLFVLNESPRWLLEEGRREEAAAVLRQLAKRNNKADDKAVDAAISAYDGVVFHRHPVDGAHARVYRGPVRRLCLGIRRRERKQHTFRDDRADHNGGAERVGDVDAARDDGGETQLIVTFAVRTTLPPSPRQAPAGEGAGPPNSAAAGPVGASSAAR